MLDSWPEGGCADVGTAVEDKVFVGAEGEPDTGASVHYCPSFQRSPCCRCAICFGLVIEEDASFELREV